MNNLSTISISEMARQPSRKPTPNLNLLVSPIHEYSIASTSSEFRALRGGWVAQSSRPLVRMEREIAELEGKQKPRMVAIIRAKSQALRAALGAIAKRTYSNLNAWETVLVARHPRRPVLRDYIDACVKDFCELHGDQDCFGNDKAIVTGFGPIGGQKVLLVGHDKGRDTKEKIERHFGCPHPEGYRKASSR